MKTGATAPAWAACPFADSPAQASVPALMKSRLRTMRASLGHRPGPGQRPDVLLAEKKHYIRKMATAERVRADRLASLLIFVIALSLFCAFMTAHHSYDAVAGGVLLYQWIANGAAEQLFHPYHILYLPLAAAVDQAAGFVGMGSDPLALLQVINALFAAGALSLFYLLARRLDLAQLLSVGLVALFGAGHSYWYFATNAESYPVSIFFLLLAFLSALKLPAVAFPERIARPGVWLGLAIGFHVTCILALPALLLAAWPGTNCEKPLRRPVIVAALALLVAVAPYAATYVIFDHTDPISGFSADLKATVDPGYRGKVWWSVEPENVARQWTGLGTAMAPEGAFAEPLRFGLLALTLVPFALVLPRRERARRLWMLVLWFAAAFVFFSSYNTASEKFASYQWAPLLLLVGFGVRALKQMRPAHVGAYALTLLLAAGTLVASFDLARQQADASGNPHLAKALAIKKHTEPDDVVIHLGRGENQYQKVYTPYFAIRRSMVLDYYFDKSQQDHGASMRRVGDRIAEHLRLKRRVFVLADAAESTESRRQFEQFHGLEPGSLGRVLAEFRPGVAVEDPDLGRLWLLEGPRFETASN